MIGFLLDTNVLSELRRPRPEPRVINFVETQPEELLFISTVTFAEIRYGIEKQDDPVRRASLTDWLDNDLRPLFVDRVITMSEDVIFRWRLLVEQGRRHGHTFGQPDLFIAAAAAVHNLVVVSRDVDHFIAAGVPTLDPWHARFSRKDAASIEGIALNDPELLSRLS